MNWTVSYTDELGDLTEIAVLEASSQAEALRRTAIPSRGAHRKATPTDWNAIQKMVDPDTFQYFQEAVRQGRIAIYGP